MPHEDKNVEAIKGLARQDDFGNVVVNPLRTLFESQGSKQTNPEKRIVSRNGSRLFLMYDDTFVGGGATTYVEDTPYGTLLKPGDGDVLKIRSGLDATYAVGYSLLPTLSFEVSDLKLGDVAAAGLGEPDLGNYDYEAKTWSGSVADGWFLLVAQEDDPETTDPATYLVQVSAGTIQDRSVADLTRGPETWGRYEFWINWYAAGAGRLHETFTAVDTAPVPDRDHPQRSPLVTSVANDTGKGPAGGTGPIVGEIAQASGNTGATFEWGSYSLLVPGDYRPRAKPKGFEFDAEASNATAGTFEVVGAMRLDDANSPGQFGAIELTSAPSTTAKAKLAVMAIDPSETDLVDGDFSTPPELNPLDSEIQIVEDATALGPDRGGGTTDIDGPDRANEVTLPGGRQVAYQQQGTTAASQGPGSDPQGSEIVTERTLPTDHYALFFLDANELGTYEYAVDFAENF